MVVISRTAPFYLFFQGVYGLPVFISGFTIAITATQRAYGQIHERRCRE